MLKPTICLKVNVPKVKNFMNVKCEQDQSYAANYLKNNN